MKNSPFYRCRFPLFSKTSDKGASFFLFGIFFSLILVYAFQFIGLEVVSGFHASASEETDTLKRDLPLFVPSVDVNSAISFSSIDAARKNRPPEPSKKKEELYYPDGFLELSVPFRPVDVEDAIGSRGEDGDDKSESTDIPICLFDPGRESTPQSNLTNPISKGSKEAEGVGESFAFWSLSIALAGLAFFVYHEYRYKTKLRTDLARNAFLCSPHASSKDFDSVLNEMGTTADPLLAASLPFYSTGESRGDSAGSSLYVDESREVALSRFDTFEHSSHISCDPETETENFDFVPDGSSATVDNEASEGFVVHESSLVDGERT